MQHRKIAGLKGDLLIHCGDMCDLSGSNSPGLEDVDDWFSGLNFDTILYTGGNHDRSLQDRLISCAQPLGHAHMLADQEFQFCGLRIYGSPWVPKLSGHAFYAPDHILAEKWAAIPAGIDVLITHTPPAGILDQSSNGNHYGCPLLAEELKRIRPRVHCFGHVHASAGDVTIGETRFINACSVFSRSVKTRKPVTLSLSPR